MLQTPFNIEKMIEMHSVEIQKEAQRLSLAALVNKFGKLALAKDKVETKIRKANPSILQSSRGA